MNNILVDTNIISIIAVVLIAFFLLWTCFCFAIQIISGLRNGIFELTKNWKVNFSYKPIRFCFLIILYFLFLVIILCIIWFMVYNFFKYQV